MRCIRRHRDRRARFDAAGIAENELVARLTQSVGYTPPDFLPAEASELPPASRHVLEALLHAAVAAVSGPIRSRHLLAGALAVDDCSVIRAFPELQAAAEPTVAGVGGVGGAANDEVAEKDQLGFADYVEAFADLIESPHTEPPVTIGIYGSWGMGKSFLLRNVGRELDRRRSARAAEPGSEAADDPTGVGVHRPAHVFTVSFNAWEYSAHEKIWPGLVRSIMDHLARSIRWSRHGRFLTGLRRKLQREAESPSGLAAVGVAVIAALVLIMATAISGAWELGIAETAGVLFGTGAVGLLVKALSTPWGQWVTRMVERQDYGRQTEGMAEIREDLEFLQARLGADGGRILVLIDDLDRCEPDKAVEVLQAIKLLLNFKSFIVMLGIDARVITGAIEKHYKGLLGPAGASGHEYLDKIVQIPFRIPEPTAEALDGFLRAQLGRPTEPPAAGIPENSGDDAPPANSLARVLEANDGRGDPPARAGAEAEVESSPAAPVPDFPTRSTEPFTNREYEALKALIPYLHPNPRHIKRLINVYRLVRSLAQIKDERRLLDNPEATTLVLLLCAQWPYTAQRMLAAIPSPATIEGANDEERGNQGADGDGDAFPAEPPLGFLHRTVADGLVAESQARLDLDQELLLDLMDDGAGQLTWADLIAIRRYTVNFNPAIEGEIGGVRPAAQDPYPAPG